MLNIAVVAEFAGPQAVGQLPGDMLGFAVRIGVNGDFFKAVLGNRVWAVLKSLFRHSGLPSGEGIGGWRCGRPIFLIRTAISGTALISWYRRPEPVLVAYCPSDAVVVVIRRAGSLIAISFQLRESLFDRDNDFSIEVPLGHWYTPS